MGLTDVLIWIAIFFGGCFVLSLIMIGTAMFFTEEISEEMEERKDEND